MIDPTANRSGKRQKVRLACVAAILLTMAAISSYYSWKSRSTEEGLLTRADRAFSQRHWSDALEIAVQVLEANPQSNDALEIAGLSAKQMGRVEEALSFILQITHDGSKRVEDLLLETGVYALNEFRSREGEALFRNILRENPRHIEANHKLLHVLRVAQRNWEARPFIMQLMQQGKFEQHHLLMLAETSKPALTQSDLEMLAEFGDHNDVLHDIYEARKLILSDPESSRARQLLTTVVAQNPDILEAQAMLGETLFTANDLDRFRVWHAKLPANADDHPQIWFLRGQWAQQTGQIQAAARCYWETLKLNADHKAGIYQLSRVLTELGQIEDAALVLERSHQLAELEYHIFEVAEAPHLVATIATTMEDLGRYWEAAGWCNVAIQHSIGGDTQWAKNGLPRIRNRLTTATPFVALDQNPASHINLGELDLPVMDGANGNPEATQPSDKPTTAIAFQNTATEAGIHFHYSNGADPNRAYIFEFSGGGMAVLDFDGDHWPDIHLVQGAAWPPDPSRETLTDAFFRNLGDGTFAEVTLATGLENHAYGHAAAAGDLDNDGFADLYVVNNGHNRLFHNNGDGTFSDISSAAGVDDDQWTLSALVADLNGDGLPDIYDVNYLSGDDLFSKTCLEGGGPAQCSPRDFPGAQDQLWLNHGDGTFENVTEQAGIVFPDGRGMGIVAADFDQSGRLSLFVANDMSANAFFVNQTAAPGDRPVFEEQGLISGLAYSRDGHADSCMGIAVNDVDNNGRSDIFVTNFYREKNNLYQQTEATMFSDRIAGTEMGRESYLLEGWGTQFLDANNDGAAELIVANGHLDNYAHAQKDDMSSKLMPTQVLWNNGQGEFMDLAAQSLGSYFETSYLGRAIACLDWNRDGLEDFGATHVFAPFALLSNQSGNPGNSLRVYLRGVKSSRDAMGATVELKAGKQTWSRQLIAGSGYCASNQRILMFGLGNHQQLDELIVRWPGGTTQSFPGIPVNQEVLLIEDDPEYHLLDHSAN
ncbi:MAG: FG-GAP-like repeat-containing protein [Pirellulaceae bacterium]|nr:FG-GAP-like repeat-containing protein [Pirellulaceae bacterium]